MGVLEFVLGAFWFILPAYFANMAPVFMPDWLKLRNVRLDFGKTLKGKPILGNHKTLHGLLWAIVWGLGIGMAQKALCESYGWIFCTGVPSGWQIGLMLGLGAIVGDGIKSFFKRRTTMKPGAQWFPWDQIDYVLGAWAFSSMIVRVDWQIWAFLIIAAPILHYAVNFLGYKLGMKEVPW